MDKTIASRIYDILVIHAGASDRGDDLQSFVWTQERGCREYRFGGSLGFGGKFYADRFEWRVGCYREDDTPARCRAIQEANAALVSLREEISFQSDAGAIQ